MKSYFEKFNCQFCRKTATKFSIYPNEFFYICDDKECDKKARVKTGFFSYNPGLNVKLDT